MQRRERKTRTIPETPHQPWKQEFLDDAQSLRTKPWVANREYSNFFKFNHQVTIIKDHPVGHDIFKSE